MAVEKVRRMGRMPGVGAVIVPYITDIESALTPIDDCIGQCKLAVIAFAVEASRLEFDDLSNFCKIVRRRVVIACVDPFRQVPVKLL